MASDQTDLFRFLHCLLLLRQARTSTVTKARPASTPRTMTMMDMEKAGEEETTVGGRTRGVCRGLGGSILVWPHWGTVQYSQRMFGLVVKHQGRSLRPPGFLQKLCESFNSGMTSTGRRCWWGTCKVRQTEERLGLEVKKVPGGKEHRTRPDCVHHGRSAGSSPDV